MRRALVIGASGQDGPYLAELLLDHGYEVFGCVPAWDPRRQECLDRCPGMRLIEADLDDPWMASKVLYAVSPDEIYNLGAVTFVPRSWDEVFLTIDCNGSAVVRWLEALRTAGGTTRFYQASTSEMFGVSPAPQREDTPFVPVSPYAAAKLLAHNMVRIYRECYGVWAVGGILFNHESPWRGGEFVTRHVTTTVAQILRGQRDDLPLGNLVAVRDWGHAKDYVKAMYLMLQQDEPNDFVIGSGVGRTVEEMARLVCRLAGIEFERYVRKDSGRLRLHETAPLVADPTRAARALSWAPVISFEAMMEEMLNADQARIA